MYISPSGQVVEIAGHQSMLSRMGHYTKMESRRFSKPTLVSAVLTPYTCTASPAQTAAIPLTLLSETINLRSSSSAASRGQ